MADVNYLGNVGQGAAAGSTFGPYGALVGAAGGLALSGLEYSQNKKQQKRDNANRPTYQIPPEVKQGLTLAEQQALFGMPEAQRQKAVQDLQRGAAYSLGQETTRRGGIAGLASLNENLNQGYTTLASQDAQSRMQKQQQVYSQLQNSADYKGQAFQLNQLNPYYENVARTSANRGSLYQNVAKTSQLALYGTGSNNGGNQFPVNSNYNPYSIPAKNSYNDNYDKSNPPYSNIG